MRSRGCATAVFVVVVSLLGVRAARAEQFIWAGQFGSAAVVASAVDSRGNAYVVGQFTGTVDFDPGPGTVAFTSTGPDDGFVVKIDASGNFAWARQIAGDQWEEPRAVATDSSGNVYIGGRFWGTPDFDPGPATFPIPASGMQDAFLLKLDPVGNFVWARQLTASADPNFISDAYGVTIDPSGNVITVGDFNRDCDADPGPGTVTLTGGGMFISKLDAAGSLVWAKRVSPPFGGQVIAYGVTADALGSLYIVGEYFNAAIDFDPAGGGHYLVGPSTSFRLSLNANGAFVYVHATGGNGSVHSESVAVDASRNAFVVGQFLRTSDFDDGPASVPMTSAGDFDVFVAKYDPIGRFVWARQLGGPQRDFLGRVAVTSTGQVYIAGDFQATADFDPGSGIALLMTTATNDGFVCKLDAAGNFLNAWQLGATDTQVHVAGVSVDPRDDVYTAGTFFSSSASVDFDPGPATHLLFPANGSGFVQKLGTLGAGTVPDSNAGALQPLLLGKLGGGMLELDWGASCDVVDGDYEIYEGALGSFASHVPVTCTTGGATSAAIGPAAGNRYYLVVPSGAPGVEGSYGTKTPGVERPASTSACLPQAIRSCP